MARMLLIDSNSPTSFILKRTLEKAHHEVILVATLLEAMAEIQSSVFDLVILDLKQSDLIEKQFTNQIIAITNTTKMIILSSLKDIKVGIDLMKIGVKDYLLKPINTETLLNTIGEVIKLTSKNITCKMPCSKIESVNKFITGKSASFQKILQQIEKVSSTNYTVIIYGESGSGKEVVAQEIHRQSKRHSMPFIAIDCGALSKELASSDLFGHEKGAFTGAYSQKIGNFEIANGGTLFLDEVANLPYDVQVSLLRVVQQRKFRRLGGTRDIDFDVRIIVATNEPLWDSTRTKTTNFREDLYHRFNEFTIHVPPLRERKEDIPFLAAHFLALANQELEKSVLGFTNEVDQLFNNHFWYGNIRELSNTIRRAALLAEGNHVDTLSLPNEITNSRTELCHNENTKVLLPINLNSFMVNEEGLQPIKHVALDAEYKLIVKVLAEVKFNKAKAARILNIDRKTLYNKLDEFTKEYESA